MTETQDYPDTAHSALKTDHPYRSTRKDLLCDECGLGQATHLHPDSENYIPTGTYRCADCIAKGEDVCLHQK